ncbi:MAG: RNA polymerase factor sigma-54 [Candidatus Cloacimonetes bacterium]|nr:RNA polymerase factor sigma-54 [Candidatus Cloacimonadota bacterium]
MTRIRQTMSHKQTQSMLLKPKMLQSLEMLAMPLLELETHLKQEMVTNPLLEMLDPKDEDEDLQDEPKEAESSDQEEELDEDQEIEKEIQHTLEESRELSEVLDAYNDYSRDNVTRSKDQDDKINFEQIIRAREDLKDDFIIQLDRFDLNETEYDFAYEIIDSCDAYGYLPVNFSLDELAAEYGISEARAREIHQIVLHLDPSGIGAHNIRECLLAQLEEISEDNIPVELISENFDDLIHKRYKKLATKFNVTIKTILNWKESISHLDPKPGLRLLPNQTNYIIPDVILKKIDNEYEIIINDFTFPRIRMSRGYREILRMVKKDRSALEYVRNKINSAKFLIKSIYLRGKTLERVTRSIIRNQMSFFYEDSGILEPLTYSVIADELQVNESTISRVVRNKYIDTPFGIMSLKDFFSSRAGKDDNFNSVSRQNVEMRIIKMIETEDGKNPLSDQDIADKLREDGINVSRRVVAKYRKAKGILNSHLRKKI